MSNTSPKSSVCSSASNSFRSDELDEVDMDLPAERRSTPSSMSDRPLNERPLNLTKRKERSGVTASSPNQRASEPAAYPDVQPTDHLTRSRSPAHRPSSFSLKTSPSKFLSSPADDRRRVGSKVARPVDGWSPAQLSGALRPAFDNSPASLMLSTSSSALDRVPAEIFIHP